MSSDGVVISARGLSKVYPIRHNSSNYTTLAEVALHRLRNPFERAARENFVAVADLDFEVRQGEILGLIGRNGAGKSTLLKILARITAPTAGRVDIWGRVGSLLEVGTGFHPELTGRENIFLNGAIIGMSIREIRSQFDAIVDFAGVEKFLDTQVKRYSSGMYVRLAFAVAAHLNTDILLVDEVLAVGDAAFQQKCFAAMDSSARSGRTVLFVSHQLQSVAAICTRALLMADGQITYDGRPRDAVDRYAQSLKPPDEGERNVANGSGELVITHVAADPAAGFDAPRTVSMHVRRQRPSQGAVFFILSFADSTGAVILALDSRFHAVTTANPDAEFVVEFKLTAPALLPGRWDLDARIGIDMIGWVDWWPKAAVLEVREYGDAKVPLQNTATVEGRVIPQFSVTLRGDRPARGPAVSPPLMATDRSTSAARARAQPRNSGPDT